MKNLEPVNQDLAHDVKCKYLGKSIEYWVKDIVVGGKTIDVAERYRTELIKHKVLIQTIREKLREEGKGNPDLTQILHSTTNDMHLALTTVGNAIRFQENIIKCLENGGELTTVQDQYGKQYTDLPDFVNVDSNEILFDPETILTSEAPKYVPVLDLDILVRKKFAMDAIELGPDRFLLSLSIYETPYEHVDLQQPKKGDFNYRPPSPGYYVILNLDQLVLTCDYYVEKQKAIYKDEAERKNLSQLEQWHGLGFEKQERYCERLTFRHLSTKERKQYPEAVFNAMSLQERVQRFPDVKIYTPKRVNLSDSAYRTTKSRTMPSSLHYMYEDFMSKKAVCYKKAGGRTWYANDKVWKYWTYLKETLKWKLIDIEHQRQELSISRQVGMETSYGMANTNDMFLQSLGIYVKRQNGDAMTAAYAEEIKDSFNQVQTKFGGFRKLTANQPLIISHSAGTHMYARRAIGVFIPSFNSIGISGMYGAEQFNDTMAHELAHFIDHKIGAQHGRRYLSDDRNSGAALLALTFRGLMNEKTDSNYLNSSKECFARALQMYYAIETRGMNAEGVYDHSPPNEGKAYIISSAFVSKASYLEIIRPLIEAFFETYKNHFTLFKEVGRHKGK